MKFLKFFAFFAYMLFSLSAFAQNEEKGLPNVTVETMKGEQVSAAEIKNEDGPMIVSFWATWCKPCIRELIAMNDLYPDWEEDTKVKIVAVSIDDARSKSRVPMIVNGKAWDFDVYIDENSDLFRKMNVTNPPHTFIFDKEGNMVWQHNSYQPGDEEEYYEIISKLARGEEIKKKKK